MSLLRELVFPVYLVLEDEFGSPCTTGACICDVTVTRKLQFVACFMRRAAAISRCEAVPALQIPLRGQRLLPALRLAGPLPVEPQVSLCFRSGRLRLRRVGRLVPRAISGLGLEFASSHPPCTRPRDETRDPDCGRLGA